MCNGTEYSFGGCQLPRSDSNFTCPSIAVVNCTEGVILDTEDCMPIIIITTSYAVIARCFYDGHYRVINGTTTLSTDGTITATGRIEVCSNFSYKSLCDQYWDPVDAQVFCHTFMRRFIAGYFPGSVISKELLLLYYTMTYTKLYYYAAALPSHYGYSKAGVAAYDVRCEGSESEFEDCSIDQSPLSAFLCRDPASNAVGVECTYARMSKQYN